MNRRTWLQTSAAFAAPQCPPDSSRKSIAAVVTEYRYNSHADVLCGRLLSGYSPNNKWEPARNRLVSLHTAQLPANDMSRDLAARHGFSLYPDIRSALTLGKSSLSVDAVVFIGEHGNYPSNDLGQKLYRRFEMFSQILDVYESSGRSVPTFFDKHFSYSWDQADTLFRRSRKLGFPLMAGSSIPFTVRRPAWEPPLGAPIRRAVAIGYGDLDAYGFHTLEALQCLVERRRGGETGIASVAWIPESDATDWLAGPGEWSRPLYQRALAAQPESVGASPRLAAIFDLHYRDGLQAAVFMLAQGGGWSVALDDHPAVSMSVPTTRPLPNWDGFVRCIDDFISTGKSPAPPERTLLVTGALAFCFESRKAHKPVETPQLQIRYTAPKSTWFQTA